MHQANAYGFTVPEGATKIDWPTIKRKRDAYIERLNGIYERSELSWTSRRRRLPLTTFAPRFSLADVEKDGVDYITGHAAFVDKKTIKVLPTYPESKAHGGSDVERQYTAERFVIAVGGTPTLPTDIPGYEYGFHSDGFFYLEELPKRAVVVGAGYIAVELAGIFHTLGGLSSVSQCGEALTLASQAPKPTSSSAATRSSRRSTRCSRTRSNST